MLKSYFGLIVLIVVCVVRFINYIPETDTKVDPGQEFLESKYTPKFLYNYVMFSNLNREEYYDLLCNYIPSPHCELVVGMTVGLDKLANVATFKKLLIDRGLIHVVVVSGYNLNLVAGILENLIGKAYTKLRLVFILLVLFLYSLFTGLQPPVLRAYVMTSILTINKYYGRSAGSLDVLITSVLLLLIISPALSYSVSFHLSSLATFGVAISGTVGDKVRKWFNLEKNSGSEKIINYVLPIVVVNIFLTPYIFVVFDKIGMNSIYYNIISIWLVSYITILGIVSYVCFLISKQLLSLVSPILYVLTHTYIYIITSK